MSATRRWGDVVEKVPFLGRRSHEEVDLGPEVGDQPFGEGLNQGTFFLQFKHWFFAGERRVVRRVGGQASARSVVCGF
jgi:hypothetical protein